MQNCAKKMRISSCAIPSPKTRKLPFVPQKLVDQAGGRQPRGIAERGRVERCQDTLEQVLPAQDSTHSVRLSTIFGTPMHPSALAGLAAPWRSPFAHPRCGLCRSAADAGPASDDKRQKKHGGDTPARTRWRTNRRAGPAAPPRARGSSAPGDPAARRRRRSEAVRNFSQLVIASGIAVSRPGSRSGHSQPRLACTENDSSPNRQMRDAPSFDDIPIGPIGAGRSPKSHAIQSRAAARASRCRSQRGWRQILPRNSSTVCAAR